MARSLPPLNALKAFEAAGRHESATLAAEELSVSHAAISRHIRDLEGWLGVSLFERTGRGLRLTDSGSRLAQQLTPLFDGLAEAAADVTVRRQRRQLVVSAEPNFATAWLVPRLGEFTSAHPDIELVIDADDRVIDFRKDSFDAAIRYGSGLWPGVVAAKLTDSVLAPVCCPDLLAGQPRPAPELLTETQLLREDRRTFWPLWLKAAGAGDSLQARGPMLKGNLVLAAAEAGQGYALADLLQAANALIDGRLVQPFDVAITAGAYYLVQPADGRHNSAVPILGAWLADEIERTRVALRSLERPGSND